ncbi:hypothetical protein [Sediminibacterium ginsengisoli]|uniref:GLPGLI family protein n=1 Tax=Sediminibacterium ginsengisoli TaxID=413434 RepID=A0A1T4RH25_9BACT|nr:hypothetical protein [Sediminibacterium ginsengisoli]SKA15330.1 hypothetical protein SAMN04488132_11276 [Sediminibacterium ginsengisoli]
MIKNLLVVIYFSCICISADAQHPSVKAVTINSLFPKISDSGKYMGHDTLTVKIIGYQDLRIYEIPLFTFNDSTSGKTVFYLMHKTGDKTGFKTDGNNSLFTQQVSADSIIAANWFSNENLDQYVIFTLSDMQLLSSEKDKETGIVQDVYRARAKKDSTLTGTCTFIYKPAMNTFEATLSKELDSLKQMRLAEVRIVNDSMKYKNIVIDPIPMKLWLEETPVSDPEKYMEMFRKYKKP